MSYAENMYQWLKRKGFDKKYEHAGIYCIKIDETIVYIGKSHNMLKRVAQHYAAIKSAKEKKYRIFAEAERKGHNINFDVLYYAKAQGYSAITDEIGRREGEYIRQYSPILNTQIPKEENWHRFNIQSLDASRILKEIL